MGRNNTTFGFWGFLGVAILLSLFLFKWLPAWLWAPASPEITISTKGIFFDSPATWLGDTATVKQTSAHAIYILVDPESAADSRAHLELTLDGSAVKSNCSYGKKFCYLMDAGDVKNGDSHQIVAKNDAGEKHATMKIIIQPEEKKSSSSSSSGSSSSSNSSSSNSGSSTSPTIKSSSCLHYEAGRCWDEYEDEMYSSGLYDKNYGYYGGSYNYPDDCDSRCQDILEDAYEEGYYDSP